MSVEVYSKKINYYSVFWNNFLSREAIISIRKLGITTVARVATPIISKRIPIAIKIARTIKATIYPALSRISEDAKVNTTDTEKLISIICISHLKLTLFFNSIVLFNNIFKAKEIRSEIAERILFL